MGEVVKTKLSDSNILLVCQDPSLSRAVSALLDQWECRFETSSYIDTDKLEMESFDALIVAGNKETPFGRLPSGFTRALMISDNAYPGEARKVQDAGFAAYLPFFSTQKTLRDVLSAVIEGKSPGFLVTRHSLAEDSQKDFRILVLEEPGQSSLSAMVEETGFPVETQTVTGRESFSGNAAEWSRYSLLLLSPVTAFQNDFEIVKKIRAVEELKTLPLVCPGPGFPLQARQAGYAAGIDDFVNMNNAGGGLYDLLAFYTATGRGTESREPWQRDVLLRRVMNERTAFEKMISAVLEDLPDRLVRIHEMWIRGDRGGLAEEMHSLKGLSGTMAMEALHKSCLEASVFLKEENQYPPQVIMGHLERDWERAKNLLNFELA